MVTIKFNRLCFDWEDMLKEMKAGKGEKNLSPETVE